MNRQYTINSIWSTFPIQSCTLFRCLYTFIILLLPKDSGYSSSVIQDPCSNKGYNWTRSSDYLWSVPCVKGDYATEMFGISALLTYSKVVP